MGKKNTGIDKEEEKKFNDKTETEAAAKKDEEKAPAKGTLISDTNWEGKTYKRGEKAPAGLLAWIETAKQKPSDFVN
jgi:hypothetical protein